MDSAWFPLDALRLVTDSTPVECIGGPDDGAFLPLNGNWLRPGGLYVPVNGERDRTVCMRYVPRAALAPSGEATTRPETP
jgi:hypothetical protein